MGVHKGHLMVSLRVGIEFLCVTMSLLRFVIYSVIRKENRPCWSAIVTGDGWAGKEKIQGLQEARSMKRKKHFVVEVNMKFL